jgi:predicted LPLAT superfamily acyltransferase
MAGDRYEPSVQALLACLPPAERAAVLHELRLRVRSHQREAALRARIDDLAARLLAYEVSAPHPTARRPPVG